MLLLLLDFRADGPAPTTARPTVDDRGTDVTGLASTAAGPGSTPPNQPARAAVAVEDSEDPETLASEQAPTVLAGRIAVELESGETVDGLSGEVGLERVTERKHWAKVVVVQGGRFELTDAEDLAAESVAVVDGRLGRFVLREDRQRTFSVDGHRTVSVLARAWPEPTLEVVDAQSGRHLERVWVRDSNRFNAEVEPAGPLHSPFAVPLDRIPTVRRYIDLEVLADGYGRARG
ncbi:MAG: hypothetical protein AAFZ65_15915, partial [Planctomycetota bacterium]